MNLAFAKNSTNYITNPMQISECLLDRASIT